MTGMRNGLLWGAVFLLVTDLAAAQSDVTGTVQANVGRPVYNSATAEHVSQVSLSNVGERALEAPVRLVITGITTPGVSIANADGTTAAGQPYLDYTLQLGDGVLGAGETTASRALRFANPDRLRFRFSHQITAVVPPALSANPQATPASGNAPLRVTFAPDVTTDTAIESFRWDFNADGRFDVVEPIGREVSFTFRTPGDFPVRLQVIDSAGNLAEGIVNVRVGNAPPDVQATATPSNGAPPLTVGFSASATDSDGISLYEWDFDGDGIFDLSQGSPTAQFTYASAGEFQPAVRVTDSRGASTTVAVPSIAVRVSPGIPSVQASASPSSGQAPLTVNFSASAIDPDGLAISQYQWDFDGDGTFEFSSTTSPTTAFRYTQAGTVFARVRATASDGDFSEDFVELDIGLAPSLSVSTDTIDTALGETATVQTVLNGDARVQVQMENRSGSVVRTLVPLQLRAAGTYTDTWDGTDDAGQPLPEGDYRAILLYELDGALQRLDLAETTGGRSFNPPRSRIPSRFSPLAGDPLDISFSLNQAAEVTAFIGRFFANTRLVTFFQRKPLGRGSHTIVWNGTNEDGQLFHPPGNDRFLFGIFAFELPDNAVFVRSGVHVSGVSAAPSIFDPTGVGADGSPSPESQIAFTLTRAGDVRLTVEDTDSGRRVFEEQVSGLAAGNQVITWDGRGESGEFVAPGRYRIGVTGVGPSGTRTTTVFALQRVFY